MEIAIFIGIVVFVILAIEANRCKCPHCRSDEEIDKELERW